MSIAPGVRGNQEGVEMIYYKIFPACKQDLFLTLNLDTTNSAVLLEDLNQEKDRDRQLWTPIEIISGGSDKGFALLNKYDNKVLAARGERQSLTQISPSEIPEHSATWTFLPVGKWGAFGGIQLQANHNMNLNAFGDTWKTGNTVGIHDWKNGASNEVWQLIQVEA
jgi:hypothetical protein